MTSHRIQNGSAQLRDSDLIRALAQGEIEAHFLPKVDLRSARVVGVEALARWATPSTGVLSAESFIDLVTEGGHERAFTERVVEFSTRVAGDWWRSGLGLQLALNLPLDAIAGSDWDLPSFVMGALDASGLPGDALQFEITEAGLLRDGGAAADLLGRLSELGATVSIDDFGTGHFSLRQLKRLPIEELKLDNSLVRGLNDEEDRAIVRSIIHLAHQLGIQVAAEGVETEVDWRQLRSMGCERAQGYLVSKPLTARQVPAWLASWNQRARELSSARRVRRTARPEQPVPNRAATAA
jgi:EAL domain-containing protein (putative c-di-GMP-specific phosphodiesterase class I)